MTIDLDSLESTAKAATPGPWEDMGNHPDHLHGAVNKGNKHIALCNHYESAEPTKTVTAEEMRANAAFIAAANPAVVLELIAVVRQFVDMIKKEREARNWLATMLGEYGKEDGSAQEWLQEAKRAAGIITEEQLQKLNNRRTPNE